MKHTLPLLATLLLASLPALQAADQKAARAETAAEPVAVGARPLNTYHIGTRRELFVDDFLIEKMNAVRLDLKHPERRETFTFDAPWEDYTASPTSAIMHQGMVRLYYRAGILNY